MSTSQQQVVAESEKYLKRMVKHAENMALCLDVDGTLVSAVDASLHDPISESRQSILEELASRLPVLTIISGRPAWSLGKVIPVEDVRRLGHYGQVEWVSGASQADEATSAWLDVVQEAIRTLRRQLDDVDIRDKEFSVAVHWGADCSDDRIADVLGLLTEVSASTGLRLDTGKQFGELLPPTARGKGVALERLLADDPELWPVVIGDDVGDFPAFSVARARGGLAIGVSDGPRTAEGLDGVVDLLLSSPAEVWDLLGALAGALEELAIGRG